MIIDPIISWIFELITDPVGFFSVVFSAALAVLYWKQYETQNEQQNIMENQQQLMEIEQAPVVQVDGFRGGTEARGGIESLELRVSNLGGSPVTELGIKVQSGFHKDTPFIGGEAETDLQRIKNRQKEPEVRSESPNWEQDRRDYLESHERHAVFVSYDLPVKWSNSIDHYGGILSLYHLREELSNYTKPSGVRLRVYLQYTDHKNEKREKEVFDLVFPLCDESGSDILSFNKMLEDSTVLTNDYPFGSESES
jgi:hypothetical protein